MHTWGDEDVDWEGINAAAEYIGLTLRKWWRVPVRDYKEKFGSVRVYCRLGWYQFHDITHPGYVYSRYPDWLWYLDCYYGNRICSILNWVVIPIHSLVYGWMYHRAVRRWPHLRREILSCADYRELLWQEERRFRG